MKNFRMDRRFYKREQVANDDFSLADNVVLQLPLYVLLGLCRPLEGSLVINVDFGVMVNFYYLGIRQKKRIWTEFACCKMLRLQVMPVGTSNAPKSQ